MAGAAKTLERQTEEFDWVFAEEQFSQPASYERPPESEVYGRSLSTMYRLGTFAVGRAVSEVTRSPEADQAKAEFYTSVEEGFGTDMELGGGLEVRDFDPRAVINGKVMAKDRKTPVSDMTHAGLVCAQETASKDKRFQPQLIRSEWDDKNALIVDKMTKGETNYNTRIVVSPFPEEAAAQSGNAYWQDKGYVPHLKRGFVQLYHANGNKELLAGSLSFDGSDKERLQAVFKKRGIDIPVGEITDNYLQYAITGTMSETEAKELALDIANEAGDPRYKKTTNTVEVAGEHHAIMNTVFNDSYIHACESLARGHQTPATRKLIIQLAHNAKHFNNHYAKALYALEADEHKFTDDDMAIVHELLVYSTIEMMRALHLQKTDPIHSGANVHWDKILNVAYLQALSPESFQNVLSGLGADGARNRRIYSACGLSISLGESASLPENPQTAFGGITSGEDRYGPRRFQCTVGHWNTRPYNKLIEKCQHKNCKGKVKC